MDGRQVLIIGAGFGGLRAARALGEKPVEVTLLDRNNYHLFQPLLYQVATAGLEPEQVARPVRALLRGQENLIFRSAEVQAVDLDGRQVITDRGVLEYDFLILAPGAQSNAFNLQGVENCGLHLKTLDDAVAIRNHILRAFEVAAWEDRGIPSGGWLTFIVVGGGPTGVEMAGSLTELVHFLLKDEFRILDRSQVRIVLVEMTGHLLPGMAEASSAAALHTLRLKGVEVQLGRAVKAYNGFQVEFEDGERIPTRTLIWAAGVHAAGLLQDLDTPHGPQGRVSVLPTLQLEKHPHVYVIGDGAHIPAHGTALPMMAPVALQMAELASANIINQLAGQPLMQFEYKNPGRLATIGRNAAVAEIGGFRFKGVLAWVVWLIIHLIQLVGFRNRLMVLISWAWEYLTYERAVRLIQGRLPAVSEFENPEDCV